MKNKKLKKIIVCLLVLLMVMSGTLAWLTTSEYKKGKINAANFSLQVEKVIIPEDEDDADPDGFVGGLIAGDFKVDENTPADKFHYVDEGLMPIDQNNENAIRSVETKYIRISNTSDTDALVELSAEAVNESVNDASKVNWVLGVPSAERTYMVSSSKTDDASEAKLLKNILKISSTKTVDIENLCAAYEGTYSDGVCTLSSGSFETSSSQFQVMDVLWTECESKGGEFDSTTLVCTVPSGPSASEQCTSLEGTFSENSCTLANGDVLTETELTAMTESDITAKKAEVKTDVATAKCTELNGTFASNSCTIANGEVLNETELLALSSDDIANKLDEIQKEASCNASDGTWNSASKTCTCNKSGYEPDQYSVCTITAEEQARLDEEARIAANKTACLGSLGSWNDSSNTCSCKPGYEVNTSGVCTITEEEQARLDKIAADKSACEESDGTWNSTSNTCTCKSGYEVNESGVCTITAEEQARLDKIAADKSACEGSEGTWNSTSNTCTCKSGYEVNTSGVCTITEEEQARLDAEKAAAEKAAAIAACIAQEGKVWNGTQCVDEIEPSKVIEQYNNDFFKLLVIGYTEEERTQMGEALNYDPSDSVQELAEKHQRNVVNASALFEESEFVNISAVNGLKSLSAKSKRAAIPFTELPENSDAMILDAQYVNNTFEDVTNTGFALPFVLRAHTSVVIPFKVFLNENWEETEGTFEYNIVVNGKNYTEGDVVEFTKKAQASDTNQSSNTGESSSSKTTTETSITLDEAIEEYYAVANATKDIVYTTYDGKTIDKFTLEEFKKTVKSAEGRYGIVYRENSTDAELLNALVYMINERILCLAYTSCYDYENDMPADKETINSFLKSGMQASLKVLLDNSFDYTKYDYANNLTVRQINQLMDYLIYRIDDDNIARAKQIFFDPFDE